MLTPVAGAVVPLTQLQSEFFSFLLGIAGVEPAVDGLGGYAGAGLSPAADAWVVSQWRLVLSLAAILGEPLAGNATGVGTLGGMAASLFGATTPPLAPNGAISMGVQSFLRHVDSELLLSGSVSVAGPCRSARRRRAYDPDRSRGATRFTGGAGRSRSVRRRRAGDPYRSRGARRIPPGQSRFRSADIGHRALRPSGGRSVRCRSFGVIGCRPSEGIARRPSGGVTVPDVRSIKSPSRLRIRTRLAQEDESRRGGIGASGLTARERRAASSRRRHERQEGCAVANMSSLDHCRRRRGESHL